MALEHVTFWAAFKNISYVALFLASIEWLGFEPLALNIFIALMCIDVLTGIARTARLEGPNSIRSSVGIRGVLKKILLLTALFSIALTAKGMGYTVATYVQGAVNVLMLGELFSILGNIHSYRTGNPKREFDAVAFLLKKVENIITELFK